MATYKKKKREIFRESTKHLPWKLCVFLIFGKASWLMRANPATPNILTIPADKLRRQCGPKVTHKQLRASLQKLADVGLITLLREGYGVYVLRLSMPEHYGKPDAQSVPAPVLNLTELFPSPSATGVKEAFVYAAIDAAERQEGNVK